MSAGHYISANNLDLKVGGGDMEGRVTYELTFETLWEVV